MIKTMNKYIMQKTKDINAKDIAATITEEGFFIGKNNAVNICLDCDALEIYTNMKTKSLFDRFKTKPFYIGTLYFKKNGEFSKSWFLDNEYFGKPIDSLKKKLEDTYGVEVSINNKYEILDKEDPGI